jgi:hypothetical protein
MTHRLRLWIKFQVRVLSLIESEKNKRKFNFVDAKSLLKAKNLLIVKGCDEYSKNMLAAFPSIYVNTFSYVYKML